VVPLAIVVARAIPDVPETIGLTRRAGAAGEVWVESVLAVVTSAETIRILRIGEPVFVVVLTIATHEELPVTQGSTVRVGTTQRAPAG
jgi:hypothetical protein